MGKKSNTNVAPTAKKDNTNTRTKVASTTNSNTNNSASRATNRQQGNLPMVPPPRSASVAGSAGASSSSNQPRDPPKRGRPRKDSGPTKPWVIALPAPRALAGLPPLYPPPVDSQAPTAPPTSQAPPVSPTSLIPPVPLFNALRTGAAKKDALASPVVSAREPPVLVGPSSLPREVSTTKVTPTPTYPALVALVPPASVLFAPPVPKVSTLAPVTHNLPVTSFLSSLVSSNPDPLASVSPYTETLDPPISFFFEPPAPMFPLPPAPESLLAKLKGPLAAPTEDWVRKRGHSEAKHQNIATGSVSASSIDQLTVDLNGCATYEGSYDIVGLNGAYIMTKINDHTLRVGGLKVTLATMKGTLFCGEVVGPLIAASTVQLVLGTYLWVEGNFSEGNNPIISGDVADPAAVAAAIAAANAAANAAKAAAATNGGYSSGTGASATGASGAGGGSVSVVDGGTGSTTSGGGGAE
ncbi:hypothetical protein J5N97_024707 [Dioscorea zingiberensis]|uniref:AT-hook motif nuclear-localized protein n=1 Tax=Dioscorea zingiberensis TaxID=325984 RepID=A0A9D5C7G6_9LILI|nr:hypothetical protein J5N97_024707 [Dioscorea zingiberensis]